MEILKDIWNDLKRDGKTRIFWKNPFKHIWYRSAWHFRPYFQYSGRIPLDVDVELSNGCNFRCIMCQQNTNWLPKKDEKFMEWWVLKKIVRECRMLGVASMKVNWRGESTLDPDCGKKIRYIKSQGIHEVQMNTNASRLTPALADSLIDSLDRIIFSCDGLSKETYNNIRKGGDFDRFVENVRMFRQRRNARDLKRSFLHPRRGLPIIRINMAVMEQNKHEKEDFKYFFRDVADEFFFNSVYQPQASNINKGQNRKQKRKGCPQIWQRLIVDVEGNVMPCCVDFREKLKLANVKITSLLDIWKIQCKAIREAHVKHKGRELDGCKACDNFAISEISKDGEVVYR